MVSSTFSVCLWRGKLMFFAKSQKSSKLNSRPWSRFYGIFCSMCKYKKVIKCENIKALATLCPYLAQYHTFLPSKDTKVNFLEMLPFCQSWKDASFACSLKLESEKKRKNSILRTLENTTSWLSRHSTILTFFGSPRI